MRAIRMSGLKRGADHQVRPYSTEIDSIAAIDFSPVCSGGFSRRRPVLHLPFSCKRGPADRSRYRGNCASQNCRGYVASPEREA